MAEEQPQEGVQRPVIARVITDSSKPGVAFIHLAFKVLALLAYALLGWLFSGTSNFVTIFVVVTVLLSIDFWLTKNVTGRMLVGLRYWNETHDDGSSSWVFESRADSLPEGSPTDNASLGVNKHDSRLFWSALYAYPTAWILFSLFAFFSFGWIWLLICALGLAFSIPNAVGFTKCSADAKAKIDSVQQAASGLRNYSIF